MPDGNAASRGFSSRRDGTSASALLKPTRRPRAIAGSPPAARPYPTAGFLDPNSPSSSPSRDVETPPGRAPTSPRNRYQVGARGDTSSSQPRSSIHRSAVPEPSLRALRDFRLVSVFSRAPLMVVPHRFRKPRRSLVALALERPSAQTLVGRAGSTQHLSADSSLLPQTARSPYECSGPSIAALLPGKSVELQPPCRRRPPL